MFNEDSQIVKNFVFLIEKGVMKESEVYDLYNLREVVERVVEKNKRDS